MEDKMKVLIGYDGSACADAALDDLRQAGLPEQGDAVVMSVAEVWLPPSTIEEAPIGKDTEAPPRLKLSYEKQLRAVGDAEMLAARAASRLRANFPDWEVTPEASWGSPAWELIFKADSWKPDLIVVGSQGRSALGRFVMGSVSQRVLAETTCSVRVARGRVEEPSPVRIIVGFDGSAGAAAAIRFAAARKWPPQSEARVVLVDDPIEPSLIDASPVQYSITSLDLEYRERVTKLVDDAARQLNSENLAATGLVQEGDPRRVIVNLAEELGANCIFVGSTGFSNRLERFLIGSVSSAIAARAHCSVEVVRQPKTS